MYIFLGGLVRMTERKAGRLEKEEMVVLTPGRFGKKWLTQVQDYLAASGPLGFKSYLMS